MQEAESTAEVSSLCNLSPDPQNEVEISGKMSASFGPYLQIDPVVPPLHAR